MRKYDVVIIGSGLGGLICGSVLSGEGLSVCVIEKNRQIGGSLQTFSRNKCIIDTGVHYVGGLDEGQNLNTFFKYLGLMDKLKLKRLDGDCFDLISFDTDKTEYKFAQGYDRFLDTLLQYFPHERKALTGYCGQLRRICEDFPMYNVRSGRMADINPEFMETSITDFLKSITPDKRLQNVLAGNNLLYAGIPGRTPVFMHALILNSYIQSSWKFVGGSSQLSLQLARTITDNGGAIMRNSKAEQLIFDRDGLKNVRLSDSQQIEGKYFISNIHPSKTLQMLEAGRIRPAYRNRINSLRNTISSFSLHLIFNKNSFPYLNFNRYHFSSEDVWESIHYTESSWPESYMFCTPASSHSPDFAESAVAMCYMRHEETRKWEKSFNTDSHEEDRGEDYQEFKIKKSEAVLDALEKKFKGIRSKVKACYSSTPLTYRDYIGGNDGSMYGIARESDNPLKTFIASRTKIPNLLLTGQNVHLAHGVLGVTVGALLTCSEIIGLDYMLNKIRNAN